MPSSEMAVLLERLSKRSGIALYIFFLSTRHIRTEHALDSARYLLFFPGKELYIARAIAYRYSFASHLDTVLFRLSVYKCLLHPRCQKRPQARQDLPAGEQWHAARALFRQRDGSVFG